MPTALLIPSYEPKPRVADFLSTFQEGEFDYYLVVDDGSGSAFDDVFQSIQEKTPFEVIRYEKNKGKGHALKTGLKYLFEKYPDLDAVVTADSDGQHLKQDILRVKEAVVSCGDAVVLGVRDYKKAPPASYAGNRWATRFFWVCSNVHLQDCQTGLRGIPSNLFKTFLTTRGTRFEFEMEFLLAAVRLAPVEQLTIETIYEGGKNKGTHFRPFADSLRVGQTMIGYVNVATIFFLLNVILFAVFKSAVFPAPEAQAVLLSNLCALGIAGCFEYFLLQYVAFGNRPPVYQSLPCHLLALGVMFGVQTLMTFGFADNFGAMIALVILSALLQGILKNLWDLRVAFIVHRRKKKANR